MHKDEDEGEPDDGADGVQRRDAPGEAGQEHEEREEVCKRGVGPVPGIFRFCGGGTDSLEGYICQGGSEGQVPGGKVQGPTFLNTVSTPSPPPFRPHARERMVAHIRGNISIGTPSSARSVGSSFPRSPSRSPSAGT